MHYRELQSVQTESYIMNTSSIDFDGCFDIKKNKLQWKGTLEELKAFVLTEVDDETAAKTAWHSPGGGKWKFESNPLAVTWLTKSQNIYFSGDNSADLIERVHKFLKRRECASETSYVEPLESQSQSEDENDAWDGSEYLSGAHNMSHDLVAANKDANIEYEKQGDSILYIKSVNQNKTTKKSLNENVFNEPFNLHKVSNECGEKLNKTSPLKDIYDNYNNESEISVLKFKFEKFAQSVTNKLEGIAAEVNNIKENKPYSIIVLENTVSDLKQEKYELAKKYDDLLTALKLTQDDCTRKHTSTVKSNQQKPQWCLQANRRDKKNSDDIAKNMPTTNKPETTNFAGENRYNPLYIPESQNEEDAASISKDEAPVASKDSYQSLAPRRSRKKVGEESKIPKQNRQPNNGSNTVKDKGPIAILGDSMIKMLKPSRLQRSIGKKTVVKTFPGASVADMKHYVKPPLEKNPELIILHVGTNDIPQKEPEEIVKEIESLCTGIVTNSLTKVAISEIIQRDDQALNIKINSTNKLLTKLGMKYNCMAYYSA